MNHDLWVMCLRSSEQWRLILASCEDFIIGSPTRIWQIHSIRSLFKKKLWKLTYVLCCLLIFIPLLEKCKFSWVDQFQTFKVFWVVRQNELQGVSGRRFSETLTAPILTYVKKYLDNSKKVPTVFTVHSTWEMPLKFLRYSLFYTKTM